MKFFYVVLVALAVLSLPLVHTGCGTPAAKTTQVAGTVTISVDAAMKSWGEYVRAGKASVEQRTQVRAAYLKYQAAMKTAETVALSVLTAPENQAAYLTTLNAASQASVEVLALIETFSKK